jgi:4-hydroxy-tetrahydrodipicolinate reductase
MPFESQLFDWISHRSSSRAGYAEGSLRAVRFLAGKPAGLYDMFDVLGLR